LSVEAGNFREAATAYITAAEFHTNDNCPHKGEDLMMLGAEYLSRDVREYAQARDIFDKVATQLTNDYHDRSFEQSAKAAIVAAGLCWLALKDPAGGQAAVQRYMAMNRTEQVQDRCQRLLESCVALEKALDPAQNDVEGLKQQLQKWHSDAIIGSPWMVAMLGQIVAAVEAVDLCDAAPPPQPAGDDTDLC